MTESEWLMSTSPETMLAFVEPDASERKLLLFGCACWRRLWHLLPEGPARQPVELAEAFADGLLDREEWQSAHERWQESALGLAFGFTLGGRISEALEQMGLSAALGSSHAHLASRAARSAAEWVGEWAVSSEARTQCHLLRDILGNPFRPFTVEPAWRHWNNNCAQRLAQEIYDSKRFEDLPILGDVLEDAGCTEPALLSHAREGGEHVRGCYVVDLVLGKG
jgi:hypothetical protein